jgi:superfamily II DNA/RNA helicase
MTAVQSTLPASGAGFDALDLPAPVVAALARQGITVPTPVQAAVVPDALAGRDVLGRAQTGSGKTLAFGLPILARLAGDRSRPKHPRALIIVPTRELATQVRRSLEPLALATNLKLTTVYGGTPYDKQIKQLRGGADIVVATPGRLDDLIKRGACRTDDIAITVLDEADHLCDLGFYPIVDALMGQTPAGSQRLLLSATLDGDVDRLVRKHLREPALHELDANEGSVTTMTHHVMVVGGFRDKIDATTRLVEANPRSIVFTRTREGATELAESMTSAGIEAVDLHGNLSQRVRERNLHKFSTGKAQVVVATDVAARGIHVDNVGLVIHYDTPNDAKAYLHRSGRTARAGESGAVITITTPRQVDEVVRLQSRAGVESLHHDIRTAPQPMTAAALSTSGESAPTVRRGGGARTGGSYGRGSSPSRGGYAGRSGYQGSRDDRGGYRGSRDDRGGRSEGGYRGAREQQGDRRQDRSFDGARGPVRRDGDQAGRPAAGDARRPQRDDRPAYGRDRRDAAPRTDRDERGFRSERPVRSDRPQSDRPQRGSYVARPGQDRRTDDRPARPRSDRPDFRDRGFRSDRDERTADAAPEYTKRKPRWSAQDS